MVLPTRPIHLDSLLAAALVSRAMATNAPDPYSEQEKLPLRKEGAGPDWVWCASQVFFDKTNQQSVAMVRPYQMMDWAERFGKVWTGKRNVIPQGTGPMKSEQIFLPIADVTNVQAWGVGDIDLVRQLLSELTGLGKVTRNGWGRIDQIDVVPDDLAEINWRRRSLPASMSHLALPQHVEGTGNVRPPYFQRRNWQPLLEYI